METCMMCGKEHDDRRLSLPILHGMCHSCSFWYRTLKSRRSYIVVEGNCYRIAPENRKGFRGHGGWKYIIEFNDGSVIETTNLWHRGKIDREFLPYFPDNAKFSFPNTETDEIVGFGDLPF